MNYLDNLLWRLRNHQITPTAYNASLGVNNAQTDGDGFVLIDVHPEGPEEYLDCGEEDAQTTWILKHSKGVYSTEDYFEGRCVAMVDRLTGRVVWLNTDYINCPPVQAKILETKEIVLKEINRVTSPSFLEDVHNILNTLY